MDNVRIPEISIRKAAPYAQRLADDVFPGGVQQAAYAVGATPSDRVTIKAVDEMLTIHVGNTGRFLTVTFQAGSPDATLSELLVKDHCDECALTLFARLVDGLRTNGVRDLLIAAKRAPGVDGYYTWPMLGAVSVEDDPVLLAMTRKKGLAPASKVEQLMSSPDGREWWKNNGWSTDLKFELHPDSYSSKVLDELLKARVNKINE